jgi:hypothetical protein
VTREPEQLSDAPVRLDRRTLRREPDHVELHEAPSGDVVVAGAPPWRPRRWLWSALAIVLVLSGSAWYGDHHLREKEAAGLAVCQRQLEEASAFTDVRLGAMANYLRPALSVTHGPRQLHLADLMSGPARRVLPGVARADRTCRAVTVRPWHFTLVAQRSAVTAYSGALVTLLQAVAAQGRAYYQADVALVRLRQAAGVTEGPQ